MNTRKETDSDPEIDEAISSAYRAIAVETSSEETDRNLLREAKHSVSQSRFSGGLPTWIRTAAVTAVAVLSLGVLLQFNLKSVPGSGAQAIPGVTDELTEAVEITGQRLRELDRAAERLSPANRPATGASTVPAPDQPGDSQSDRFCDAEMTRTPAAWWACIEKLNRSGNLQSAQSELERLEAEFPDYRPSR